MLVHPQHVRFRIAQGAGVGIVKLEDHLRMREGKPALAIPFHRVVEDVVHLHHAVMREGAVGAWDVLHRVAAPADVAGARAVLEPAVDRSSAFILHRRMIDGVVWTTCKFIDVIGDLDGEAVVQIASEHKDSLCQLVPKIDQFLHVPLGIPSTHHPS